MICKAEIEAGICGFRTTVRAQSEDAQHVAFEVVTDCENILRFASKLSTFGSIDAFEEINPVKGSRLLEAARSSMSGCCAGCAVPVGVFKAMQVAAGLALPKDVHIVVTAE